MISNAVGANEIPSNSPENRALTPACEKSYCNQMYCSLYACVCMHVY